MGRGDGGAYPVSPASGDGRFPLQAENGILPAWRGNPAAPQRRKDADMAIRKERNRHLTDDQRLALEAALRERKPFAQVSRETGDPPLDDQEGGHEPPRGVDEDRFNPCARPDRPSPLPSYFLNRHLQ